MNSLDPGSRRKRVCILGLGGGGYHLETERLFSLMESNLELVLIYVIASQTTGNWRSPFPLHRAFVVRSPSLFGDPIWRQVAGTIICVWKAFWILLSIHPDCILAVGTAQAVPFGIAARILGIPLLFIESVTRVQSCSRTGKLLNRMGLATHHYVQWEELAALNPKVRFSGSVFL